MNIRQVYFEQTIPGASWPSWHVAGWLTLPDTLRRSELQILLHGAGYDHRYWDWPVQPEHYSYAAWAAAHGIATLAIDRIGTGFSTHPPAVENTLAAQAQGLSQIIAAARRGLQNAPSFERVVLIGHSLGSVVAGYEAATYGHIDAVVLTGYLPIAAPLAGGEELFVSAFLPAAEALPHLRGLVGDGYVAARTEMRTDMMFRSTLTDPTILPVDEQIRTAVTMRELLDSISAGTVIRQSTVPVLSLVGQFDVLLFDPSTEKDCHDAVRRVGTGLPANFEFEVISDTGHNLNLHRNAHDSFAAIERWLGSRANSH